jgi:CheY-like chemotaxis protein
MAEDRKYRLLLVEDVDVIRNLIRRLLAGPNREIVEAKDGVQAIGKLKEKFDLLIVDKNLPGVNGLAVIRHAKSQDPYVNAVLITSYSSDESRKEAEELGVDDYIEKPFNAKTFTERIEELLSLRLPAGDQQI